MSDMRAQRGFPEHRLLFQPILLIYQLPKIGSQSLEATLRQCSLPHSIHRFHYLSSTAARNLRRGLSSPVPSPAWKSDALQQLQAMTRMSRLLRLRRFLCFCGCRLPKVEVISGVRELISLMLASVFENYAYFGPTPEALTLKVCREALLHPKTFASVRDWFDLELKPFLGIDAFKRQFPREQAYAICENRFCRVLIYRFGVLEQLPILLKKFLGCEIPALAQCNLGQSKAYADHYRFIKEHLRLPPDFVWTVHDCKMMRHFYSDAERQNWRAKWTGT